MHDSVTIAAEVFGYGDRGSGGGCRVYIIIRCRGGEWADKWTDDTDKMSA